MSTYTAPQYRRIANTRLSQVDQELTRIEQLQSAHRQSLAEVEQQCQAAEQDLVKSLLPQLDAQTLSYAAGWAGLPTLAQEPLKQMELDRQRAQRRLAEIEREPLFVQRSQLADPEIGTLRSEIRDLEAHCQALYPVTAPAEGHKRWARLQEVGYGTDRYQVGWWRLSHFLDWKASREVAALYPGLSFAKVLESYQEAKASLASLESRLGQLRRDLRQCEQLTHEHSELQRRLETLSEIHLERTRQRLAQHLKAVPAATLMQQFQGWPALLPLVARYTAVQAKASYLAQLHDAQLAPLVEDLETERDKLTRLSDKLRRPKNQGKSYPAADIDASFGSRPEKVQRRLERYEKTYTSIYHYNSYEAVDFSKDVLWWDIFTQGKVDGSFIPEVADFRSSHPDYAYERHPGRRDDWESVAAVTVVTSGPTGTIHHHDFS